MGSSTHFNCPNCPFFKPRFFGIETCVHCGLGRTVQNTQRVEDQDYFSLNQTDRRSRLDYFNELYIKYFQSLCPGRFLDIGCSHGDLVRVLADKGWIAHGIDSYRGFPADGKNFFRASLENYQQAEPYDLITMIHSFEHMPDPVRALEHVAQLLSANGVVLIVVPNFGGLWSRMLGDHWHMLRPDHHVYHYTCAAISHILNRCGFLIIKTKTYSGYAPSPWQIRLAERRFYESGWGAVQPFKSLLFRVNSLIRPFFNAWIDYRKDGAEIHVLATKNNHFQ